jgi:LPXTG-motif cell wall-anchored protein
MPAEGSGVVVVELPQSPAEEGVATESPAHEWARDFFVAHSEIQTPKGSDAWSSDDWADFLESPESAEFQEAFFGAFMDSDEAAYVDDLTFFFVETNDEEYIYEMFDFLNASFPNHPGLAEGLFYVVINMLVEAGYLEWEDGAEFPTVPETPAPIEKPDTPKNPEPGQVPVVKPAPVQSGEATGSHNGAKAPVTVVPAGTITPPQAQDELAQTGASSALMFSGLGALLVALGAVFVRLRRRLS